MTTPASRCLRFSVAERATTGTDCRRTTHGTFESTQNGGRQGLPSTDGDWRELEFPIQKITKVHNVILRFFGSRSESLMDLEWVKFR